MRTEDTLSGSCLEAFGIKCCSRYSNAHEMRKILQFLCELDRLEDESFRNSLSEVFYDSKAGHVHIRSIYAKGWRLFDCPERGLRCNVPPKPIMDAACAAFHQFLFDDDDSMVVSPMYEVDPEVPYA